MSVMYQQILPIEQVYEPHELQTATAGRRLGAYALDAVIAVFTLLIGWYIWLAFTAPNGQTPGKQLVGLYVIRDDGTRAGGGFTWLREALVKGLLFAVVSAISSGLAWIVAALWLLWDRDRQCLWDKITNTHVAYSPHGYKPQTLEEQQSGGTARRRPPGQQQTRAADGTVTTYPPGTYRPAGPPAPAPEAGGTPTTASSPAAVRLRELQRLREEDLITAEEYETRRSEAVKDL